jgi:hypothetical protein
MKRRGHGLRTVVAFPEKRPVGYQGDEQKSGNPVDTSTLLLLNLHGDSPTGRGVPSSQSRVKANVSGPMSIPSILLRREDARKLCSLLGQTPATAARAYKPRNYRKGKAPKNEPDVILVAINRVQKEHGHADQAPNKPYEADRLATPLSNCFGTPVTWDFAGPPDSVRHHGDVEGHRDSCFDGFVQVQHGREPPFVKKTRR